MGPGCQCLNPLEWNHRKGQNCSSCVCLTISPAAKRGTQLSKADILVQITTSESSPSRPSETEDDGKEPMVSVIKDLQSAAISAQDFGGFFLPKGTLRGSPPVVCRKGRSPFQQHPRPEFRLPAENIKWRLPGKKKKTI